MLNYFPLAIGMRKAGRACALNDSGPSASNPHIITIIHSIFNGKYLDNNLELLSP